MDMEASAYVDATLRIYRSVRERSENVGVCLQAYLRRTPDDLDALIPLRPSIRLVKGAYREPPDVAYPKKREVDAAYAELAARLLEQVGLGRLGRVGLATHDERMIQRCATRAGELGLAAAAWEVETLFGIAPDLEDRLLSNGVQLRVLISYGSAWFSWYMRRLAERPANLLFVAKKLVGL
jgi:proline dehydrogenase